MLRGGGGIYTCQRALENGVVYSFLTMVVTVKKAAELAELDDAENLERLLLPKPTSPFEQLFGPIETSAQPSRSQQAGQLIQELLPAELGESLRQVWWVNQLSGSDPRLLLRPYQLRIH